MSGSLSLLQNCPLWVRVRALLGLMFRKSNRTQMIPSHLVHDLPLGHFQPFAVGSKSKMSWVEFARAGEVNHDTNTASKTSAGRIKIKFEGQKSF